MDNRIQFESSAAWESSRRGIQPVSVIENVGVLSEAFNPLHRGHHQLHQIAGRKLNLPIFYELSTLNVDKAEIDEGQLQARLNQNFSGRLIVTQAATFVQKSQVFRDCHFVIGADTAERLLDPAYYGQSEDLRDRAMVEIDGCGNRFLVAGRFCAERERFVAMKEMKLPACFAHMFFSLSETAFRCDMSSSQIRQSHGDCQ